MSPISWGLQCPVSLRPALQHAQPCLQGQMKCSAMVSAGALVPSSILCVKLTPLWDTYLLTHVSVHRGQVNAWRPWVMEADRARERERGGFHSSFFKRTSELSKMLCAFHGVSPWSIRCLPG